MEKVKEDLSGEKNKKRPKTNITYSVKKTHIHTFWLASLSVRVRFGAAIWWLWETKVVGFHPFIGFADINIIIDFHSYFKVTSVNDVTF